VDVALLSYGIYRFAIEKSGVAAVSRVLRRYIVTGCFGVLRWRRRGVGVAGSRFLRFAAEWKGKKAGGKQKAESALTGRA
jgi:hypothetical protein